MKSYANDPDYLAGFAKSYPEFFKEFDPEKHPRDEAGQFASAGGGGKIKSWIMRRGGPVLESAVSKIKDPENAKQALAVGLSAALSAVGHMDQGNIQDQAVLSEVQNFAANVQVSTGIAKETFKKAVDGLLKIKKPKIEKLDDKEMIERLKLLRTILDRLPDDDAVEKMVPYAEGKPYMREEEYIAGRAGAADGTMEADPYFSPLAGAHPSGPGLRGRPDPKRQRRAGIMKGA